MAPIPTVPGPVRNVMGQTLVSNAAAWPWGALAHPVGYDENGTNLTEQVYGNKTWTGTDADGTATGVDCQDASGNSWNGTSTSGTQGRGYATEVTNGWLNGGGIDGCTRERATLLHQQVGRSGAAAVCSALAEPLPDGGTGATGPAVAAAAGVPGWRAVFQADWRQIGQVVLTT